MFLPTPPPSSQDDDVKNNKDVAAFSYVWIMSVFIYFLRRESPFVVHHAKQGIVLFLLSLPLLLVPFIGHILTLPLIAAMMFGFIQASHGHWSSIPLIGDLSRGELQWSHIREGVQKMWTTMRKEYGEWREKKKEETKSVVDSN